jgi:hypothetical protein
METSALRTALNPIRLGGSAALLAGLCYGAAGYFDKPDISGYTSALVSVLGVATPALFLGGLLGLHCRLLLLFGAQRSFASAAGLVVSCLGAVVGVIDALVGLDQTFLGFSRIGSWWWVLLLAGLTLMGLATLLREGLRCVGVVVLASGALGWVSLLTDPAFPGVLVPTRPVHVAFAALFCPSCVVWAAVLYRVEPFCLRHPEP